MGSRPRSKTRKVSLQISKDSSSLVSNLRMEEPSPTTTSKRSPLSISSSDSEVESNSRMEELFQTTTSKKSQPSTWSSDLEVVCKSSSRPSPVRPSPSMLSQLTPLRTSKLRSKTRRVSLQTSKDLSSLESSSRTAEPSLITTSKRSPPSIWS